MKSSVINEYQAAALVAMSPSLLKAFVSYAAKHGDPRKLKVVRKDADMWFFEKDEVLAFDKWLRQAWPTPLDTRPRVPDYIENEIKVEANGECAICLANANSCEAAHIDPVATSKCNHPHNLIWLCANHHTKFDKHLFAPKEDYKQFVVSIKDVQQRYKTMLWRRQAEISAGIFEVLDLCSKLKSEIAKAVTDEQATALESIAKSALSIIPNIAPVSQIDKKFSNHLSAKLQSAALTEKLNLSSVQRDLDVVSELRDEYLLAAGLIQCPLCFGAGNYCDQECPACAGDGTVDKADSNLDLYAFALVPCPLTRIHAQYKEEGCPGCSGNDLVQRRFADLINPTDYDSVDCQQCKGTGREGYDECRVCHGEKQILRCQADHIDFAEFEHVDCPLCSGTGREGYDDCRVCYGSRQIERRHAESLDLSQFGEVNCPLCNGTGSYDYEDCSACGGNRTMPKKDAERVDVHSYEKIKCLVCGGTGELYEQTCRACRGDGRITRETAANISLRDYERVDCRRCGGTGHYRDSECFKCGGNGMVLKIDD